MARALPLSLVLCLLAVLALAPAANGATRIFQGSFGSTSVSPALGGTFNNPQGVAVNSTGNGGVPAGTTYVVDRSNNRIQRFNSAGQFLSAWGRDVVGVDEKQTIAVRAKSGQFKLTFEGQSTANLTVTATAPNATAIQNALRGLSSIGGENVTVTGGPPNELGSNAYTVTFTNGLGGTDVPEITATNVSLAGGNPSSSITIATTVPGTGGNGFESCSLAADCKIGITALPTGGAFNQAQGIAVNQATGNVYVTNRNLNRVDQFSSTGGFIRAWGAGVITGGAAGTGTLTTGSRAITSVATTSKAFAVGQTITGTGIPAATEIVAIGAGTITLSQPASASGSQALSVAAGAGNVAVNERQTLTLGANTTGGAFKLSFAVPNPSSASATTAAIAWDASPAAVQAALEALANIGAGNVEVTSANPGGGVIGGPYAIEFKGTRFADTNVSEITAPAANLSTLTVSSGKQTATIATTISGAGSAETCTVAADCTTGQSGTGAGQFAAAGLGEPTVDSTGSVYVSDGSNRRVQKFDEDGSFDRAFGWDVVQPGGAGQSALNLNEQQEIRFSGSGSFTGGTFTLGVNGPVTAPIPYNATGAEVQSALEGLAAVGAGNVSVTLSNFNTGGTGGGTGAVGIALAIEFTGALASTNMPQVSFDGANLTGIPLIPGFPFEVFSTLSTPVEGGIGVGFEVCTVAAQCKNGTTGNGAGQFGVAMPESLTIGGAGAVYANDNPNSRVQKFSSAGAYLSSLSPGGTQPYFLSGDEASGEVFISSGFTSPTEKRIQAYDSAGSLLETIPTGVNTLNGLGYYPQVEGVYATTTTTAHRALLFAPVPPATVKLDPASEVGQSSAKLSGTIAIPSLGGGNFNATYSFEYSADNGLNWIKTAPVEATFGPSPTAVSRTVIGLQPGITYRSRLAVTTSTTTTSAEQNFTTAAAKPAITETIALPVTGTTAKLRGKVNPNNSPTTYRFEWGETSEYGNEIPDFEPFVGSGGQGVPVSATLSGLQMGTTYHFRIVATNANGTTKGPDATFTTNEWNGLSKDGLPDNRGIELVSPADKRPQGQVRGGLAGESMVFQAAADGQSVFYPIQSGMAGVTAGGFPRYIATRSEALGWQNVQASAPSLVPSEKETASRIKYYSGDLSCGVVETHNPLTADVPAADEEFTVVNLYRRDGDGDHTLLTPNVPSNPDFVAASGSSYYDSVVGASADCKRIFFTPKSASYKLLPNASGLYEWQEGSGLRDAGLLPNGAVPAPLGGVTVRPGSRLAGDGSKINAVGANGNLFFTALSNAGGDAGKTAVFVRKDPGDVIEPGEIVDVSQKAPGGTKENLGARYEMASPDGNHVFFAANYGLTGAASAGPQQGCDKFFVSEKASPLACDLYDYDVGAGELTNLSHSTDPANTNGADVKGVVAVSDDGSRVYFAALGQLVPGQGRTYAQNLAGTGSANIYMAEDGALTHVATVAKLDLVRHDGVAAGIGGGNLVRQSQGWTAQTTPSGSHLLFTSTTSATTGYESGGVAEAYLYAVDSGATVCVSCRPDGQPSLGNAGTEPIRSIWRDPQEQHGPPRSLSSDGSRVFFTMPDVLAPGAVAEEANLYEWEKGQVYLLGTFPANPALGFNNNTEGFIDASADGDDVFVVSSEQLDPRYDNIDFVQDLYDLRVDGGFPDPAPEPVPCDPEADTCQGPVTPAPAAPNPPSQGFSGPGNPPAPQAKKKAKKKKKQKKNRAKKHKRASHNRGGAK